MTTDDLSKTLTARFLAATASTRRRPPARVVENDEFVTYLFRMVRALERRAIEDPAVLPQVIALAQRLEEVTNVAIFANAERFRVDPRYGASQAESGRILGVSKQAASQRAQRGHAVMLGREASAGVIRFAEARREKEIVQAAHNHAVINLADYFARRKSA